MILKKYLTASEVIAGSLYKVEIDCSKIELQAGLRLIGEEKDGTCSLKRNIDKQKSFNTVFIPKHNGEMIFSLIANIDPRLITQQLDIKISFITENVTPRTLLQSKDTITAAIASFPLREESLKHTIDSLLPQVDQLCLYLNGYSEIPSYIRYHAEFNKIHCILDFDGERRAAGKFHWIKKCQGYYLTCDDDIIYADDYVKNIVSSIDLYNKQAIVSFHGMNFFSYIESFKRSRKSFYKFTEQLNTDKDCQLLGTGVSGLHTSLLKSINLDLIEQYPYAVDPALSVIAKKYKLRMVCLAHEQDWLSSSEFMQFGLHELKQLDKSLGLSVDELLKAQNPWGRTDIRSLAISRTKSTKMKKMISNPKLFLTDSKFSLARSVAKFL